jgi:hypothetical protein
MQKERSDECPIFVGARRGLRIERGITSRFMRAGNAPNLTLHCAYADRCENSRATDRTSVGENDED